ncbi:MAG TPA: alpha/beta fold hydrolase, partial [Paracoccaceae bacterium]|nr:alpha/beta fold hydrolase [Paracoccaceae bacterium]
LLGYCMGGTLATAIAASGRTEISSLVTLGAPWDLGGSRGVAKVLRAFWHAKPGAGLDHTLDTMGNTFGAIPVAFFQYLFALINPMQAAVKFRKFADLDQDSPAAFNFAAIEDWLADGIPMTPPAAKDLLVSWFVDNALATGTWRFLGAPVDPAAIRVPSLVICGVSDSITPLSVAQPLGTAIPDAVTLQPHTGHVGMIVGKSARSMVWDPIAGFLHANVHRIT